MTRVRYFTFPDGVFRYDCQSCRQRCCRGKGITLSYEEVYPLLLHKPGVASALRLGKGGTLGAFNSADGCWFLEEGGLCSLETERGRQSKPMTCRLFPFNRIYQVGEVQVIDVNSYLCPVQAAEGEGVRHEDLVNEVAAIQALCPSSPLLSTPAPVPPELPADWPEREVEALARPLFDRSLREQERIQEWAEGLGLSSEQLPLSRVGKGVEVLAGSLRWNRLFRKNAGPYPQTYNELPRRLQALSFLGAASSSVSLRGLSELWEHKGPLLDVLCHWDDPVRLHSPSFSADVPAPLQRALGPLLAGAFRGGQTLGQLVRGAAAVLPKEDRPLVFCLAADLLPNMAF